MPRHAVCNLYVSIISLTRAPSSSNLTAMARNRDLTLVDLADWAAGRNGTQWKHTNFFLLPKGTLPQILRVEVKELIPEVLVLNLDPSSNAH